MIEDILNQGQLKIHNECVNWWKFGNDETFEISGPPGSGKTFLLNAIIDSLGVDRRRIAPMAYTGSASINMRTKGMFNARTMHSWLYDYIEVPLLDENGREIIDPVFNKPKKHKKLIERKSIPDIDLVIVDEAGSVPEYIGRTLAKHHIPIIATGDLDQLPPVEGKSAYLNDKGKVHILTEFMRQSLDSAIIYLSQRALNGSPIHCGFYGDVLVIYEDELTDDMIKNSQIVICGKNKTRDEFTNHVRHDILNYNSTLPLYGERLVCRKNNWNIEMDGINLTNGLLGNVINYPNIPSSMNTDGKMFLLDFKPDLGNFPFKNLDCDYKYFTSPYETRKMIKDNPYAFGEKFEYGYSITTHMSQGSEYNNGIYIEEYLNPSINKNLNYVGLSRFKKFCIYVKRRPKW